jgi:hypothetical protein
VVIDVDGDVLPCEMRDVTRRVLGRDVLGNLRAYDHDLGRLLAAADARAAVDRIRGCAAPRRAAETITIGPRFRPEHPRAKRAAERQRARGVGPRAALPRGARGAVAPRPTN